MYMMFTHVPSPFQLESCRPSSWTHFLSFPSFFRSEECVAATCVLSLTFPASFSAAPHMLLNPGASSAVLLPPAFLISALAKGRGKARQCGKGGGEGRKGGKGGRGGRGREE